MNIKLNMAVRSTFSKKIQEPGNVGNKKRETLSDLINEIHGIAVLRHIHLNRTLSPRRLAAVSRALYCFVKYFFTQDDASRFTCLSVFTSTFSTAMD